MTTIRVTMTTNSAARRADVLAEVRSAQARHNGGKLVIVTLDADDVAQAIETLDADTGVREYEVA